MMYRPSLFITIVVVAALAVSSSAFVPSTGLSRAQSVSFKQSTTLNMGFGLGDDEPKKLTRENEPEEFFSTNLDKLSDEEKIPIALMGLAGISLPFILGLIALYASK